MGEGTVSVAEEDEAARDAFIGARGRGRGGFIGDEGNGGAERGGGGGGTEKKAAMR